MNIIPKGYFGKFQPDLFFLFKKDEIIYDDCLLQFKNKIEQISKYSTFMISGKIRFVIRGTFATNENKKWFIPDQNGPHLLTCVWARDTEFGIDLTGCFEEILYNIKKYSSSKNTCYHYVITII